MYQPSTSKRTTCDDYSAFYSARNPCRVVPSRPGSTAVVTSPILGPSAHSLNLSVSDRLRPSPSRRIKEFEGCLASHHRQHRNEFCSTDRTPRQASLAEAQAPIPYAAHNYSHLAIVMCVDVGTLLSVSDAADELGVNRQRVLAFIDGGRLPAVRLGNGWWISVVDLTRFAQVERRPGRPLSPARAWRLLRDAETNGTVQVERGRVNVDGFQLVHLVRRRAVVHRMHVLDRLVGD